MIKALKKTLKSLRKKINRPKRLLFAVFILVFLALVINSTLFSLKKLTKSKSKESNLKRMPNAKDHDRPRETKVDKKPPNKTQNDRICSERPAVLSEQSFSHPITEESHMFREPKPGGIYDPIDCEAMEEICVIVPYRNRSEHLGIFVRWMHYFLQKQNMRYSIYIIEQDESEQFNRAMLMNVGYTEARGKCGCFVFHDIDLLPLNFNNIYRCGENPRHLSAAVDTLGNRLPHWQLFGGACALTKEHMEKINGFPNDYWGWGGEDDDISRRLKYENLSISRYPKEISKYFMIKHEETEKANTMINYRRLLMAKVKYKRDGLNSLKYNRISIKEEKYYTKIAVQLLKV